MLSTFLSSLRGRMALLLAVAVLVTVTSVGALVGVLGLANAEVDRLVSAQRRLERLSVLTGRIGDYALTALQAAQQPDGLGNLPKARDLTREAFQRFEDALGEDIARTSGVEQQTLLAARSRTLARLRAQFEVLDRQIQAAMITPQRATGVRVALDVFAAGFGPPLGLAMEEERIAAHQAQETVHDLRIRTVRWSVAGVILALLLAAFLYHRLGRSLINRVAEVATAAAEIARGRTDTRLTVTGHDELSLAMARFNRMALHLARREAKLVADQRRLQEIVDARTAELRGANERLEHVDQARRRFFTDVSHELRTPLTVILGEAEITLRGAPTADDLAAALRVIQARARRLHRRVEDLLRIARSETGQIELEKREIPVAGLFAEVEEDVASLVRARGLMLERAVEPGLVVEADGEWLRQVLEGLVANAVRHSSPGTTIRLAARLEGAAAVLTVRDQGEGIARDELPHVFERFFRGTSGGREGGGFGIGLALAKWVVDRHEGTIGISSVARSELTAGPVAADEETGEGPAGSVQAGTCVEIRIPALVPHGILEAAQ
ncbi:HAMP domain-containing histidine kinase [Ancylobacter sp. 6x-1]|uniref:histidine kinase n=1 Tax=Ancylobacter crimeensis TaxID=2579147 RepID=A0ABT0D8J9_9HYPH|nr:ATP-binding protein [Ancylobacter crimeensis]MCK0196267.1 HAMP domain-containing histidine kinase [Ancylobacter crimeensis]